MVYLMISLIVLAAVLLVLLVIIQNSKGGGLNSSLRGVADASQLLGVRKAADFAEQGTWYLMGALVVLAFAINVVYAGMRGEQGKSNLRMGNSIEGQRVNTAPTAVPNVNELPKENQGAEKKEEKKEEGK